MGAYLAGDALIVGCRGQVGVGAGMGAGVFRRLVRSGKKRGLGVRSHTCSQGKTKIGKGSKIMLATDGNGLPIGLLVASASPHEVTLAKETLQSIRVPQKRGRPTTRPHEVVADKAYDSKSLRDWLRSRGISAVIPHFERRARKTPKKGRPFGEPTLIYKSRWKVERTFAWLQNYRRLEIRRERLLTTFRAFVRIACVLILLRHF